MEILKDKYSITELSQCLNITDHALRYYEKEFSINIPKDERGRRYYPPQLANLMYQIKSMRDSGLEIKAIRKILVEENSIAQPDSFTFPEELLPVAATNPLNSNKDIQNFFNEWKDQISICVSSEISSAREQLSVEILKTKLELGACVENSVRKLETKMERHFQEVDQSLAYWRKKNRRGPIQRLINRLLPNNW